MSEFIKMKLSEARAKFEQIDELSEPTVRKYYNKAGEQGKKIADKMKMGGGDWSNDGSDTKTLKKRAAGRTMALKRRSGEVKMSEESEQIDELSKETLGSYAHKAKDQLSRAEYKAGVKMGERTMGAKPSAMERAYNVRANKRHAGLTTAIDKLTKEEVENLDEISQMMARAARDKAGEELAGHRKAIEKEWDKQGRSSKPNYGKVSDIQQQMRRRERLSDKVTRKLAKEEAEAIDEGKLGKAITSAVLGATLAAGGTMAKGAYDYHGKKDPATGLSRSDIDRMAGKNYQKEAVDGCMLDTSMGGADQIAQSKTGEIYKKLNKSVDAMNTTAVNKRVPAVESAILDVMAKTFEKRKMFEDASNIAIISPEQRQDWLNVSTGSMEVVDYFNKYKV